MSRAWGDSWGESWADSWGEGDGPVPVETNIDGSGLRVVRKRRRAEKRVRPLDTYRTPEDIRREQLETERYLASLERKAPPSATTVKGRPTPPPEGQAAPVPQPILADVAARAALAVQAKLEGAAQAATAARLAHEKRRRTLALLLALD